METAEFLRTFRFHFGNEIKAAEFLRVACPPEFEEEGDMSMKRYRPEEIIAKLREASTLISQGKTVDI
jgi:hypothetical protein